MAATTTFSVALWQSVSRHLDIAESTESTAKLVAEHVPLKSLTARRVEQEHRRVRVVANWPENPDDLASGEIQLPEAAWNRLERWRRQNGTMHTAADESKAKPLLDLLQVSAAECDWLLAPLTGEHGSRGILAALAGPRKRFTAQDIALFEATLEPMGIALDNDSRLHELASL